MPKKVPDTNGTFSGPTLLFAARGDRQSRDSELTPVPFILSYLFYPFILSYFIQSTYYRSALYFFIFVKNARTCASERLVAKYAHSSSPSFLNV
jgi:hypothetical protein